MRSACSLCLLIALACSLVISGGCSTAAYEKGVVRELSLHAYDEGMRFAEEGNYQVALDRFNRSAIIDPRPASYFELGKAYEKLDNQEEAAVSYVEALEKAPDYQEARFALMSLGYEPPGELEIKSDPDLLKKFSDDLAREIEVRKQEKKETKKEMTEEERKALRDRIRVRMALASEERTPTQGEVRAVLFPAGGETTAIPSATEPTFAADREIILDTYPYHFANGQRFQKNREYEKAAAEYQLALNADPGKIEARVNLGDVMMKLERYPQALFHFTTAREQFPESPRPLLKLGNYYDSLKQGDLARQYYTQSLAKDPKYVEAINNLAAIEIRERNFPEAIKLLKSATEIDPNYALAFMNLGIAYENGGDKASALQAYKQYVELGGEQSAEVRKWITEMQ